ncbi:hypothetical protein OUZ56_019250 [Daphnia magna]|uniref:Uncharacterized protein n=1 Tax=Daphnia magna TaxID=35525 RepID=A0ABQ9ZB24_9CRUS|nr:hypothetical protein OUZ56_019250 [Daphnia magna]
MDRQLAKIRTKKMIERLIQMDLKDDICCQVKVSDIHVCCVKLTKNSSESDGDILWAVAPHSTFLEVQAEHKRAAIIN